MRLVTFKGEPPKNSLPKTSVILNLWKIEMISAVVTVSGFHAAIAMSGIASKRGVLAKHEISKSSAKAPIFLVHSFVISNRTTPSLDIDRTDV